MRTHSRLTARFKQGLRETIAALGLVTLALWLTSPVQGDQKVNEAAAMMREAHDGRATWTNFPGFHAKVRCHVDGTAVEGDLTVTPSGDMECLLDKSEKFSWVERTLDSVIGHRLSDGEAITNVGFADNDTRHPQGRLIKSRDPAEKSLWRAKGDVLTEVHRIGKDSHLVISIVDVWRTAEGKHLPKSFVVTKSKRPGGEIESVREVYNEWKRVGSIDLPTLHRAVTTRADGTRVTHQIEFDNYSIPLAAGR